MGGDQGNFQIQAFAVFLIVDWESWFDSAFRLSAPSVFFLGVSAVIVAAVALTLLRNARHRARIAEDAVADLREQVRSHEQSTQQARQLFENEVGERESRFRALFDDAPLGYHELDSQGRIAHVNQAELAMLGYTAAEMHGKFLWEFVADSGPFREAILARLSGAKLPTADECNLLRKDATELPVLIVDLLVYDNSGGIRGVRATVQDLSAVRAAREELRKSEEHYRDILDRANNIVYRTDEYGHLTFFNPTATRIVKHPAKEILNRHFTDLIHPSHRREAALFYAKQRDEGTSTTYYEFPVNAGDGSEVWIGQNVQLVAEKGRIVGFEAVARDITQRKQAEAEIQIQKAYLEQLVENAPETIVLLDREGRVTRINSEATRLFGYSREEFLGSKLDDLIVPDELRGEGEALSRQALIGKTVNRESVRHRKNGSKVDVSILAAPILYDNENLGTLGIYRDITERKRLDLELARARDTALESARLKSEFLANMSHEIRTPMNGIIGMAELLANTELQPEQHEFAGIIRSSAEALLVIVNDILDFSKIEAGKLEIQTIDFDLRETLEGVLDIFGPCAAEKGLELNGVIRREVPTALRGDPNRLRQVLVNLVGNAVKFTEKGEVTVEVLRALEEENHVVLGFEVRDTGIGIPQEAQPRLFRAFSQADSSTTRRYGGTGLGLVVSKNLVELMGGAVGFVSKPALGSTFWFSLKLERQNKLATDGPDLGFMAGSRVLVVNDHETSRKILEYYAVEWKMRSEGASSGKAALEMMNDAAQEGDPYRLAILDQDMPDMSGLTLARAIKSDPKVSSTCLILMTSVARARAEADPLDRAIDIFITKPIKYLALQNSIARSARSGLQDAEDLSLEQTPTAIPEQPSISPARASMNGRAKILIAEDNPVNQRVIMLQMKTLGYDPDLVGDGIEALEAMERKSYSLVLLDCQMPNLDGYDTAREIRRREANDRHVLIIAITAHALGGELEKCKRSGMDDYLSKPFHLEQLALIMKHWLPEASAPLPQIAHAKSASGNATIDTRILDKIRSIQPQGQPSLLGELIDLFLQDVPTRMTMIHKAIIDANAPELARAAHYLKGSSGNLGAKAMLELCETLDDRGRRGIMDDTGELFDRLREEFMRVREVLETEKLRS